MRCGSAASQTRPNFAGIVEGQAQRSPSRLEEQAVVGAVGAGCGSTSRSPLMRRWISRESGCSCKDQDICRAARCLDGLSGDAPGEGSGIGRGQALAQYRRRLAPASPAGRGSPGRRLVNSGGWSRLQAARAWVMGGSNGRVRWVGAMGGHDGRVRWAGAMGGCNGRVRWAGAMGGCDGRARWAGRDGRARWAGAMGGRDGRVRWAGTMWARWAGRDGRVRWAGAMGGRDRRARWAGAMGGRDRRAMGGCKTRPYGCHSSRRTLICNISI